MATDRGGTVAFTLMRPDGSLAGEVGHDIYGAPDLISSVLDATGTWTLTTDPQYDTTGSITFTAAPVVDQVLTVTPGKATKVTFAGNGAAVRLNVAATTGQRLTFSATSAALTAPDGFANPPQVLATLNRPSGQSFPEQLAQVTDHVYSDTQMLLDADGTWTVVLTPQLDTQGTAMIKIGLVTDVTAKTTLNTQIPVRATNPGQNFRYTFAAKKGQTIEATLDASSLKSGSQGGGQFAAGLNVSLYDAGGTDLADLLVPGATYGESAKLAAAGTYTLVIDPAQDTLGTAKVGLRLPVVAKAALPVGRSTTVTVKRGDLANYTFIARQPVDVTGSLTTGKALTVALPQPGQQARYTFHGVAGKFPVIDSSKASWASADGTGWSTVMRLIGPDGADYAFFADPNPYPKATSTSTRRILESFSPNSADGSLDPTGTWTLVIDPSGNAVGSETFTLRQLNSAPPQ